jgi:hypothetical protein
MRKKFDINRRFFLALSAGAGLALCYLGAKNVLAKKPDNNNLVKKAPGANARLGVNLAGLADWNTELPFVDLFRMSREWVSQPKEGAWGSGPKLNLDENGWVKSLEKGCWATRVICSLPANQYPSGDYVVLYDGEGELTSTAGQMIKSESGRLILKVDAKKDSFLIDLIKTNPQNHLRNIRVISPGFESTYLTNPWHPSFLKRWSGIACLRFMDFMSTNNSAQVKWAERPKLTDASFANKGIPLEMMVDLANRLYTDAWFCMPHQADDNYIKQFAIYVKNHLNPELQAWIEYSNEVWNGGFEQHAYAAKAGQRLRFADKPWEAAWRYYAYRSVQIFKIWTDVYNEHNRFVRVLASQAANEYASDQILSFQDAANKADVLAIAPYVSFNVSPSDENGINDKTVSAWSLDKLFEHLNKTALPESLQWVKNSKKVANEYGLNLVAYEAGQHLVGVSGAENNDKLTQLFKQANADNRMGEIYTKSLAIWTQLGGDLSCSYYSVGGWSKWGSWGLLKHYADSPTNSPKLMATIKWAISRGQKMAI